MPNIFNKNPTKFVFLQAHVGQAGAAPPCTGGDPPPGFHLLQLSAQLALGNGEAPLGQDVLQLFASAMFFCQSIQQRVLQPLGAALIRSVGGGGAANGVGQVFRFDDREVLASQILHTVAQLPDVPRPAVPQQKGLRLLCQHKGKPKGAFEFLDQRKDILPAAAQGRQVQRQGTDPVKQVAAEPSLLHHGGQVLIGGTDNAHINGDDPITAHPHHLPLLDDPQQLQLRAGSHALDLVQENGAGTGQLKKSRLAAFSGTGEGAVFIAEQLALQQAVRQGGAVDGHKRRRRPGRAVVNGMGKQLFSGAALPCDEDGGLRPCHFPGQLHRLPDLGAAAANIRKPVFGHTPLAGGGLGPRRAIRFRQGERNVCAQILGPLGDRRHTDRIGAAGEGYDPGDRCLLCAAVLRHLRRQQLRQPGAQQLPPRLLQNIGRLKITL